MKGIGEIMEQREKITCREQLLNSPGGVSPDECMRCSNEYCQSKHELEEKPLIFIPNYKNTGYLNTNGLYFGRMGVGMSFLGKLEIIESLEEDT